MLSYAATLEVRNVDIAVFNEDAGRASHELVERIGAASFVDDVVVVDRPEAISAAVDHREVLVGIHIARGFFARHRGRSARDRAGADRRPTRQLRTDRAQLSAERSRSDYGAELTGSASAGMPQTEVRNWFNENLIYLWFFVPGMTGILVMFTTLVVTALSIAKEREQGTFDQLLVSPSIAARNRHRQVHARVRHRNGTGGVDDHVRRAGIRHSVDGFDTAAVPGRDAVRFSLVGIGLMLSSICETQQQAILGVVRGRLSDDHDFRVCNAGGEHAATGCRSSREGSPLKHFLVIIQGSFTKAMPPLEIFANAWPMVVIGVVTLSLAMVIVKRKLQ